MNVFAILRPEYTSSGENARPTGGLETVAVVLSKEKLPEPYIAHGFRLFTSEDQPVAFDALQDIEKMSEKSRSAFGLSFDTVAGLRKMAEAQPEVSPGDTVYVDRRGEKSSAPFAVYKEKCYDAKAMTVFADFQEYLDDTYKRAAIPKLDRLSAKAKRTLGLLM